jgi:hypothetical protein
VLAAVLALLTAASAGMSAVAGAAFASTTSAADGGPSAPSPSPADTPTGPDPVDAITVDPAAATPEPGGEVISVTANSTTALASMTVHLLDATSGVDTLDLIMNAPAGGAAPGQSTWTSSLISSPTLPLGTYNVTVDAADAGTSVTGAGAGTFAFQAKPSITLSADSVVSYDNRTPTVSGTVTTLAPGAATAEPYANRQVVIKDSVLGNVTVTTSLNGGYSFKFADPEPEVGEHFTVAVQPTPSVAAATTAATTFTGRTDPVALTASLSAKTVTYGGRVTVAGTVTYEPHSVFVPLPGQSVQIYDRPGAARPVATARTDTTGRFTATLPREPATVHWVLKAGGNAASPYLGAASVTLPMKVSLPTVISGFQAALNQFWQVSYRGCLTLPAGVPAYLPNLSGLVIQYAPGPSGPWRTLGAVPRQTGVLCGNGGRTFGGTFTARLNYAYYRAWYAGVTDVAGTGYLSSVSGRVLAWKYEDRIAGFSVSPRILHGNKPTLTVSGQLQYYSGKWLNYAKQTVYVILRPQGSSTWYYMDFGTTGSTGKFSFTFTFPNPVSATWSAEFFGNSAHLATVAATLYIPVTAG